MSEDAAVVVAAEVGRAQAAAQLWLSGSAGCATTLATVLGCIDRIGAALRS